MSVLSFTIMNFLPPRVKTMSYGTETIKYRGKRLFLSLPQHTRNNHVNNFYKIVLFSHTYFFIMCLLNGIR